MDGWYEDEGGGAGAVAAPSAPGGYVQGLPAVPNRMPSSSAASSSSTSGLYSRAPAPGMAAGGPVGYPAVGGTGYGVGGGYGGGSMGMGIGGGVGAARMPVGGSTGEEDYSNEPPLLEELGINFEHIWVKTKVVMVPVKNINVTYLDDTDLAGPLVFALIFGFLLLFSGKVHFGYIYGFGAFGCVALTLVLNLLSEKPIDVWRTLSVLGYCILPIVGLSAVNVILDLTGFVGLLFSIFCVCWSTMAATKLFELYLDMREQRWLIAYPIILFYCCFVLITVF
jgi:hypothetical protein